MKYPISLVTLATASMLSACTTARIDAQWSDPQRTAGRLRGAPLLMVCESNETVTSRICADRLRTGLQARGANVIVQPENPSAAAEAPRNDARYLPLARELGASAVWAVTVAPEAVTGTGGGSGVSIGLGGFGFGRRGGGGVGLGVGVPIGDAPSATLQYAADARLLDAGNGRLLWTARAAAPPPGDLRSQVENLMQALVDAGGGAQLF